MIQNKGLIFKSVPTDWPVEGKDLIIEDRGFDLDAEPPKDGITTKNYYLSFDPFQRGRMRAPEVASYSPPFTLGKPITNSAVARILKSDNSKFKEGDIVTGTLPTEEYSSVSGEVANSMVRRLDNPFNLDPKLFVGALGMPGLTAYSSFYAIGEPKKGETIFISAASGAVGQIVGQLAKHEGLNVIGSVGSDEKLDFIRKELNFDEGFNYKKEKPSDALKRLAPKGIDIYFENVGGEQLDAAIRAMNNYGRISKYRNLDTSISLLARLIIPTVACGMISQYNISDPHKKCMLSFLSNASLIRVYLGLRDWSQDLKNSWNLFHCSNFHPKRDILTPKSFRRDQEPRRGSEQASQNARLHCLRREHGPQIRGRSPEERGQVDLGRDIQSTAERDHRH